MPSAQSLTPVVCPSCSLRQFATANSICRRCRSSLPITDLEIALPYGSSVEDFRQNVSRVLRVLRARRSMTQTALASASGVHRTYLSRAENGQVLPSLLTLARLARALGVDRIRVRTCSSQSDSSSTKGCAG